MDHDEEYIRVRKDEYEKLLYFKRRYDEQNKIHHEVAKEMQEEIDQLERNCDVFNEQMSDAVERATELQQEKEELVNYLKERYLLLTTKTPCSKEEINNHHREINGRLKELDFIIQYLIEPKPKESDKNE